MHFFAAVDACGGSLADAVHALRTQPTELGHLAFYPAAFVRAPLPLRPVEAPVRVSINGDLVSTLACGYTRSHEGHLVPVGLPYGMLARLVVLFLVTYAVRRGTARVPLGDSLSAFMRALGVERSGGKNGRIAYLYDQLSRLAACTLSERWSHQHAAGRLDAGANSTLVEQFALWSRAENGTAGGTFTLSPTFYSDARGGAVPVDLRAVHALRRHPLAFDAYVWATRTAARLETRGQAYTVVSWRQLFEQFGRPRSRVKDFARAFLAALRRVRLVWPLFTYRTLQGRLVVSCARPHVPRRLGPG